MKYSESAKRAVATFVFASTGILIGGAISDLDIWKTALWTGVGSLINYIYRASEEYINSIDAE
jgi:hypothetical protein